MALCKILVALLGTAASLAAADFRYEHFKTFNFDGADGIRKPWFLDDYAAGSPSQILPQYAASPYPYDNYKHGTEPIPSVKKIPVEDKSFKKAISPFYTLSDSDDPKFKEIVLKSGAPYCQEITAKDSKTDLGGSSSHQKQMTCYRCKDPKNGSSYEHCSYTSRQPSSREARSNVAAERTLDSLTSPSSRNSKKSRRSDDKLPEPFVFSEDYFHPEPSHDVPAEYEKNIDNCERIVKDSMVCMLCKDPKTNGKYEQCSYVAQPNEKAYAYTKSSSFGGAAKPKPRDEALKDVIKKTRKAPAHHEQDDDEDESEAEPRHHRPRGEPEELADHHEPEHSDESTYAEDKEGHGTHYVPDHTYHYPSYKDYKGSYGGYEAEEEEEDASPRQSVKSKANCKTLDKDGQTCTVCTDPKTGGKSENCNYSHEPKDKVYKYSKSKSFGYPESSSHKSGGGGGSGDDKAGESSEKQERESSAEDHYGGYHSEPSTLDYIRSESEKISKKVKDRGDCREEKRDGMICTICKDPKTGGDFEQCNYSFEPEDKVFAYSKSKSFGSPTKTSSSAEEADDYGSGSGEERQPEESYSSPVIYPTGTSPLDYIPKSAASESHTTKRPQDKPSVASSKVDTGFYDATKRRAEIEKIVQDIGAEDRSKCKKVLRGGMTCYRCADDKGFTNEECVFVNDPEGDGTAPKEKKLEAAATPVRVTARPPDAPTTARTTGTTSTTTARTTTAKPLEPLASTSWKSSRRTRETKEEKKQQQPTKDKDEELEVLDEELDEAEPYDYVAETRPVYDKVLGLTLPAYMLHKSQHEIEFDEIVEKAKFT